MLCVTDRVGTVTIRGGVNFRQKHNYDMAKMVVFIAEQNKNYMFRSISAIIRFSQLVVKL